MAPRAPPRLASELRAVHEARTATRVALESTRVLHASLHALVVSCEELLAGLDVLRGSARWVVATKAVAGQ